MIWYNSCPRCTGDVYDTKDANGFYVTCHQCGFLRDVSARTLAMARNFTHWTFSNEAPVVAEAGERVPAGRPLRMAPAKRRTKTLEAVAA